MTQERQVLVLQGPNLNLLGTREPETYGRTTLDEVTAGLDAMAASLGVRLRHVQSNHEGVLIDAVQAAGREGFDGALVNAGGFTHTSVALRDAFVGVALPFVEVHVSNIHAREPFRHTSLLAEVALGSVVGLGPAGYGLALQGLLTRLG